MPAKLRIVPQSPAPEKEQARQRIKAMPKPAAMLQCRCGGREFVETRTGAVLKNGKPSGGTKVLLCLHCLMRGERVVVA